jgi:hypothetical protein
MSFKDDFVREHLFRLGLVCIGLGVMVFAGATPRGMKANALGGAWLAAAVLVGVGLILLGIDHYLNR